MLVQSRMEGDDFHIELLPALPKAWPAGAATGLGARGGFLVDVEWKDGVVTEYAVRRRAGLPAGRALLRVNGRESVVEVAP